MKKYKLSDLFDLQMGKTPARNNPKYWEEGTNPWISIADMSSNGKYITTTKECITDRAISDTGIKPIFPGTVIMSFKLSIGKVARTTVKSYSNEAIMAFEIKDREPSQYTIDNDYAYYLLSALNFENIGNKAVMGKTLNKAILENTEVYVHPWDEQRRIISKLDKVIELIELRTQQLSKLDELVKSRFIELFGDIKTGDYKFETRKLGEVAEVGSSHRVFTTEFVEEGIPFYRGTEIGELANGIKPENPYRITKEHYDRLASDETKPKVGDLLMPSICNKGQVWMVDTEEPFYYKDGRVLCISPNRKLFNCKYLEQFMREKTLVEYPKLGSGSTFAEFKIFLLKDIEVLIPPIELQDQFAAFVEQTDKSKSEIQKSLEKLETLKKALMQKYFG